MELLLFWLGLSVIIGVAANTRGRTGVGWFLLALFISPLIAGLLVLVLPSADKPSGAVKAEAVNAVAANTPAVGRLPCPLCAEPIRPDAKLCPHCRSAVSPIDPAILDDFPETWSGIHYRKEPDGSVLIATHVGPRRYSSLPEFWRAMSL